MELAIRDLKDQALAHFPSGKFLANAAWTVIAALAHNLLRWTTLIGLPDTVIPTARTIRRRLLTVPGRITRTARTVTLRMPARWPWETRLPHRAGAPTCRAPAHLTHDRGQRRRSTPDPGLGLPRTPRPRRRDDLNSAPPPPRPNPIHSTQPQHSRHRSATSHTTIRLGTVDPG